MGLKKYKKWEEILNVDPESSPFFALLTFCSKSKRMIYEQKNKLTSFIMNSGQKTNRAMKGINFYQPKIPNLLIFSRSPFI